MPRDVIDIETALTKHYLNASSVNESDTCGLNLYHRVSESFLP